MEICKVDLGIRLGVPKGYRISITRSLETPLLLLGPQELLYDEHSCIHVCYQNSGENKITLKQGTWLCQVSVSKCVEIYNSMDWSELDPRNPLPKIKVPDTDFIEFTQVEGNDNKSFDLKGFELICPSHVFLGTFRINFLGTPKEMRKELYQLQEEERKFANDFGTSCTLHYPAVVYKFELAISGNDDRCQSFNMENYRDLEHHEFIELQVKDYNISRLNEALMTYRSVVSSKYLGKGRIVYKRMRRKGDIYFLAMYIPSKIVKMQLLHTHLSQDHPSARQTYKIFSERFYHPQSPSSAGVSPCVSPDMLSAAFYYRAISKLI
jgi:hypothetical protein